MQSSKTINCLIVDDEPIARRVIRNHLSRVEGFSIAAECSKAMEAFQRLQNEKIDLLFLDIQMPRLSGLELLRSLHRKPKVIIVSAYREYALEGFELDVLDYLLKPVSFERFLRALDKFRQLQPFAPAQKAPTLLPAETDSHLFIRADRKNVKLELAQILYIESMSDYLKIHTPGNTFLTKEKISIIEQKLPARFLRIHRSFIINLQHLQAYTPEMAEVAGKELPISRSLRQEVMAALQGS